jgi:hypothetical protein
MKMTQKLADELMDCLACLAISALGGVRIDENGKPYVPDVLMDSATAYARNTFIELTDAFAQNTGEEWEIIPTEEEE